MVEGLRTALAWAMLIVLAKVESPSLKHNCGNGEYDYSGICCKKCPAGTYVDEPCNMPHTSGICVVCTEGKDFTAHENGLDMCLPCNECKSGKTMVKLCTVKSNTECQCNDGYYCPPGCEECLRCKKKCPEGKVPVKACNATADMECGPPPSGASQIGIILIVIFVTLGVVCVIFLCFMKYRFSRRKEEKGANNHFATGSTADLLPSRKNSNIDALPTESREVRPYLADPDSVSHYSNVPESIHLCSGSTKEASSSEAAPLLRLQDQSGAHNEPSNVLSPNAECSAVIKPSQDELSEICGELLNKVPVKDWKRLMRIAGLSDNEMDRITSDYPSNTHEQHYHMLKRLYDTLGTEEAFDKLLRGLRQMQFINIYENLINELLSKNITIKEDKGKFYFVKNVEQNL